MVPVLISLVLLFVYTKSDDSCNSCGLLLEPHSTCMRSCCGIEQHSSVIIFLSSGKILHVDNISVPVFSSDNGLLFS